MRVPKRRSEELYQSKQQAEDLHMTPDAIERMKRELERLLAKDRPDMIKEVQRTAEMGDFSENFAYQQAKHALRRINARIMTLEDKITRAIPIQKGSTDGIVRLGSTATVRTNGRESVFEIVGPHEANPMRGRISHVSPLGMALIGHKAGETVVFKTPSGEVGYLIISVT